MKTFISLLRGINVNGENRIGMPGLKQVYDSLGFGDVVTYIQSGNVVFDCTEKDPTKIAKMIEGGITKSFGSNVRVILRDKGEFNSVLRSNPFLTLRKTDPEKLYVTFLSDSPSDLVLKDWPPPPPDPRTPSTPHSVDTADGGLKPPRLGAGESKVLGSWRSEGPPANSPNPAFIKHNGLSTAKLSYQANNDDEFMVYDREVYLFCPNGYGKTKFSNTFFEKKLGVSATTRNWKTVNALSEIAERR